MRAITGRKARTYEEAYYASVWLASGGIVRSLAQDKATALRRPSSKSAWPTAITASSPWRGITRLICRRFPHDVDFVVGQSDPKKDWPWIQPGPSDAWAGSRPHAFKITFDLPDVAAGYYRLVLDFVDTHGAAPPRLTIGINGTH